MTNQTKRRGKGKKPAMQHVNLRLPTQVIDFYKERGDKYTEAMRQVLIAHYKAIAQPDKSVSPPN